MRIVMMYLQNNFEIDKNVCIQKNHIFTSTMIIDLTPHDPKTP